MREAIRFSERRGPFAGAGAGASTGTGTAAGGSGGSTTMWFAGGYEMTSIGKEEGTGTGTVGQA